MPSILATVTHQADTGLPRDQIQNSFAVSAPDLSTVTLDGIATAVQGFFNDTPAGQLGPLASFLSPVLSGAAGATIVDLYDISADLGGTPHGSPIYTEPFTPAGQPNTAALPSEVAICMSIESTASLDSPVEIGGTPAIRPKQRRRGRLFVGPLNTTASNADTSTGVEARPSGGVIGAINEAALDLFDSLDALGCMWSVWSRTEQTLFAVNRVFVDNAFDTVRSRGQAATTRTFKQLA